MTIYVDEILVSFNVKDRYKYEYKLNDIKYCPIVEYVVIYNAFVV